MFASLKQLIFLLYLVVFVFTDTLVNCYDIVLSFEYSSEFLSKGIHTTSLQGFI